MPPPTARTERPPARPSPPGTAVAPLDPGEPAPAPTVSPTPTPAPTPSPTPAPTPGPERPDAPTIEVDTGANDTLYPIVSGRAEPGAEVTVAVDGDELARITADPSGAYITEALVVPSGRAVTMTAVQTEDGAASPLAETTFELPDAPSGWLWYLAEGGAVTGAVHVTGVPGAALHIDIDGAAAGEGSLDATGAARIAFAGAANGAVAQLTVSYADGDRVGPSASAELQLGPRP